MEACSEYFEISDHECQSIFVLGCLQAHPASCSCSARFPADPAVLTRLKAIMRRELTLADRAVVYELLTHRPAPSELSELDSAEVLNFFGSFLYDCFILDPQSALTYSRYSALSEVRGYLQSADESIVQYFAAWLAKASRSGDEEQKLAIETGCIEHLSSKNRLAWKYLVGLGFRRQGYKWRVI